MQAVTSMVGATVVADDVSRTPKSGETMQLSDSELENDYCGPAHYLKEETSGYSCEEEGEKVNVTNP
ncbi:hypothetical protein ACHAXM_011358 [Skeletonema potamos]